MSTQPRTELERRMDEFDLARKALKWLLAHGAYWDRRFQALQEPAPRLKYGEPFIRPPADVEVFIHALAVELDLEAESAG